MNMPIIYDYYVFKVEIVEAPDDLKIRELEAIVEDVARKLTKTAKVYWNDEKGYCEDKVAGRLLSGTESGFVKCGLFRKYSWYLEFNWVNYEGKLTIKKG
jgi:hypothetical protein